MGSAASVAAPRLASTAILKQSTAVQQYFVKRFLVYLHFSLEPTLIVSVSLAQ